MKDKPIIEPAPPYAEELRLNDYLKVYVKPSKLIPGATVFDKTLFTCPRCEKHSPEPEHGSKTECGRCGLKRYVTGNSLQIWE